MTKIAWNKGKRFTDEEKSLAVRQPGDVWNKGLNLVHGSGVYCLVCGKEVAKRRNKFCSRECWRSHPSYKESQSRAGRANRGSKLTNTQNIRRAIKRVWNSMTLDQRRNRMTKVIVSSQNIRESSIERRVREFLIRKSVSFQTQVQFGPYFVDFFVPDLSLIIEVFGCHWHACPTCGLRINSEINRRDNQRIEFLRSLGYKVRVIWEHEFKREH